MEIISHKLFQSNKQLSFYKNLLITERFKNCGHWVITNDMSNNNYPYVNLFHFIVDILILICILPAKQWKNVLCQYKEQTIESIFKTERGEGREAPPSSTLNLCHATQALVTP